MQNNKKPKVVKVDYETHRELSLYKLENDCKTLGEAIKHLLDKKVDKMSEENKSLE